MVVRNQDLGSRFSVVIEVLLLRGLLSGQTHVCMYYISAQMYKHLHLYLSLCIFLKHKFILISLILIQHNRVHSNLPMFLSVFFNSEKPKSHYPQHMCLLTPSFSTPLGVYFLCRPSTCLWDATAHIGVPPWDTICNFTQAPDAKEF